MNPEEQDRINNIIQNGDWRVQEGDASFYCSADGTAEGAKNASNQAQELGSTLEETPAGKELSKVISNSDLTAKEEKEAWNAASEKFAEAQSGNINTVTNGADPSSSNIFYNTELPAIMDNSDISSINGVDKQEFLDIQNEARDDAISNGVDHEQAEQLGLEAVGSKIQESEQGREFSEFKRDELSESQNRGMKQNADSDTNSVNSEAAQSSFADKAGVSQTSSGDSSNTRSESGKSENTDKQDSSSSGIEKNSESSQSSFSEKTSASSPQTSSSQPPSQSADDSQ